MARRAREAERAELERAYMESLREDEEVERREEATRRQEASERARAEAERARAEEERARAEEERARAEEELDARLAARRRARDAIAAEPAVGSEDVVTVKVRLAHGEPLLRRFRTSSTAAELFAWVGAEEALRSTTSWSLVLPSASIEGGLLPTDETLDELGILGRAVLFVQDDD